MDVREENDLSKPDEARIMKIIRNVSIVFFIVLIITVIGGYVFDWEWTGFPARAGENGQPAKTLWDWLDLFVMSFILAVIATFIDTRISTHEQARQEMRENEIEREKSREQAQRALEEKREQSRRLFSERMERERQDRQEQIKVLQDYFDRMNEFLLDKNLRGSAPDDPVRDAAHIVTKIALSLLSPQYKREILNFLYSSELIIDHDLFPVDRQSNIEGLPVSLRNVNLQDVYMENLDLRGVDLRKADLRNAIMVNVILLDADLSGADLESAYFYSGNLVGTNLTDANLRNLKLTTPDVGALGSGHVTILPDGTAFDPEGPHGFERFIKPTQADFFEPSWLKSRQPRFRMKRSPILGISVSQGGRPNEIDLLPENTVRVRMWQEAFSLKIPAFTPDARDQTVMIAAWKDASIFEPFHGYDHWKYDDIPFFSEGTGMAVYSSASGVVPKLILAQHGHNHFSAERFLNSLWVENVVYVAEITSTEELAQTVNFSMPINQDIFLVIHVVKGDMIEQDSIEKFILSF